MYDGKFVDAVTAPTSASLQDAAMRGTWWTAVQAMIALPVAFGVNVVVARSLGPNEYGTLAVYMAAYGIVLAVLNGGMSDGTLQWAAAAHGRGDRAQVIELARRCAGYHVIVEAPLVVVATLVILRNETWIAQLIGAVAIGVTMMVGTTVVMMTALSLNARLAKLSLVIGLSVQLAVVTAAVQSHSAGPTWLARLALTTLGPLLAVAIAPKDIRWASLRPLLPRKWPPGLVSFSVRTMGAGLVTSLVFSRSEIFILDAYGDVAAAGVFALAAGLSGQITAPIDAMLGPLIPAAASLLASSRERVSTAVLRGIRLSGLATAPVMVIAVPVVAVLVPIIYGNQFGMTGALFVALGFVSCLQSVLHPIRAFLTAWRRPMLLLGINLVSVMVDLALAVALIPAFGAAGAVVGNSVGQLLSLGASTWLLRHFLQLPIRDVAVAIVPFGCSAVAGTAAAVGGLLMYQHGSSVWLAALSAVVSGLILALLMVRAVGGAVTEDDLGAVGSSFPRLVGPVRGVLGVLGLVGTARTAHR